jgi:hypothetical protein
MKRFKLDLISIIGTVFLFAALISFNAFAEEKKALEKHATSSEQTTSSEQNKTEEQKLLYSAGPWKGKVLDAKTKKPIEGAVVAAIWYREYDTRFTPFVDFHEAKEVLTDKDGYFEIPAYTETGESKKSWRKPQIQMPEGPIEFFVSGPIIRNPEFIIYKPSYNSYPKRAELIIFAAEPFDVDYRKFYSQKINDEEVTIFGKDSKSFPEGLVYSAFGCFPVMGKFSKKTNFSFKSVFLPLDKAKDLIEKLDIPLDCPGKGEPIPVPFQGYKNTLKEPLVSGGFAVIELAGTTSEEERLKAIPEEPKNTGPEKLPVLYNFISEEKKLFEGKKQDTDKK